MLDGLIWLPELAQITLKDKTPFSVFSDIGALKGPFRQPDTLTLQVVLETEQLIQAHLLKTQRARRGKFSGIQVIGQE